VENAFGIVKKTFGELLTKSNLNMSFLPDVFTCCCLLHNLFWLQTESNIHKLMRIIEVGDVQITQETNMAYRFNADIEDWQVNAIEREEMFKKAMCMELCNFLQRQKTITLWSPHRVLSLSHFASKFAFNFNSLFC